MRLHQMLKNEYTIITCGIILSIVLLFRLVSPFSQRPDVTGMDPDRFWSRKKYSRQQANVVVVGGSRVYRGIDPSSIENQLKNKDIVVRNLGYSSGGLSGVLLQHAETVLKGSSSEPRVIVLGVSPYSLTPKAALNEHYQSIKKYNYIQLFFANQPYRPFHTLFEDFQGHAETGNRYLQHYYPNGWVASDYSRPDPKRALRSYRSVFNNNRVNPLIIDALQEQIREWRRKGIVVTAFRPPSTSEMVALENELSGYSEAEIRTRLEDAGAVWLDLEVEGYSSYDGSHSDAVSAEKFSILLGKSIAELLKTNQ